jgi:DNA-binding CsgD family transcriptional regulator
MPSARSRSRSLAEPTLPEFAWTFGLAIVIAVAVQLILRVGRATEVVARPRPFVVLPAVGIVVAALAYAFGQITDQPAAAVLLSGQDALPHLVSDASSWSLSALAWLIVFKRIAYGLSLGSFRGGPTFPALFLGSAAGITASQAQVAGGTGSISGGEALSTAELRTLQYFGTHLTQREIAERLHLTRNTVHTHAVAIYRKLGVTSRSDAVEVGRQHGLLDH